MIEYLVNGDRYLLSYRELKEKYGEFIRLSDEEFIKRLPEADQLAGIIRESKNRIIKQLEDFPFYCGQVWAVCGGRRCSVQCHECKSDQEVAEEVREDSIMDNQLEKTPEFLWWASLSDLERHNLRKKYEISLYAIYEAEVLNIEQSWQLCPKCNGEGALEDYRTTTCPGYTKCDVCSGKKIISTLTGLPPITNQP